jgi:antitoxin VapB
MRKAKVFKSGNSQALRLPKDFQFNCDEVEILRRGNEVIIREIPQNLARAYELLVQFPDDFYSEKRLDLPPQKRSF